MKIFRISLDAIIARATWPIQNWSHLKSNHSIVFSLQVPSENVAGWRSRLTQQATVTVHFMFGLFHFKHILRIFLHVYFLQVFFDRGTLERLPPFFKSLACLMIREIFHSPFIDRVNQYTRRFCTFDYWMEMKHLANLNRGFLCCFSLWFNQTWDFSVFWIRSNR